MYVSHTAVEQLNPKSVVTVKDINNVSFYNNLGFAFDSTFCMDTFFFQFKHHSHRGSGDFFVF